MVVSPPKHQLRKINNTEVHFLFTEDLSAGRVDPGRDRNYTVLSAQTLPSLPAYCPSCMALCNLRQLLRALSTSLYTTDSRVEERRRKIGQAHLPATVKEVL